MSTEIRLAGIEDCDDVWEIVRAAYSIYVRRIGREPQPMTDDYAHRIREAKVYVLEMDAAIKAWSC